MLNALVTILCCIGAGTVVAIIICSLNEYSSSRKKERKKRQDSLDEINRSLESIIQKLR